MFRSRARSTTKSIIALLGGHIEPGRRLIRDQELRATGKGDGDHDPLAHAAGQFERIGMIPLFRVGNPHLLQRIRPPPSSG